MRTSTMQVLARQQLRFGNMGQKSQQAGLIKKPWATIIRAQMRTKESVTTQVMELNQLRPFSHAI